VVGEKMVRREEEVMRGKIKRKRMICNEGDARLKNRIVAIFVYDYFGMSKRSSRKLISRHVIFPSFGSMHKYYPFYSFFSYFMSITAALLSSSKNEQDRGHVTKIALGPSDVS
jgi:hypothetical protein